MRIISLSVENIKRVSAVEVVPGDASLVVIAGGNEQGKSSTIDAIEMALGGERRIPEAALRRGASKGRIVVDCEEFIVERRFTKTGTSLVVTAKDGAKRPSPQALLDGLYSRLSFDPLAFAQAKDEDQNKILRALAGIDTADVDARRLKAYNERTLVNRDVKTLEAQVAAAPKHADVPAKPIATETLMEALRTADHLAGEAGKLHTLVGKAEESLAAHEQRSRDATARVADLQRQLELAEEAEQVAQEAVGHAKQYLIDMRKQAADAGRKVPDRAQLHAQVAEAHAANAKIADNKRHAELAAALKAKKKAADDLEAEVNNCDVEKHEMLAKAKLPIDGLGVTDTGVTWQGLPFRTNASTAVRIRVSVAIGAALNPTLRVILVRSGNDLDRHSLALLAALAEEFDLQVWVERIAGGDGVEGVATVVIEDGEVQS